MSQLDINHNSRPPSSSSLHHWNINDNNRDQRGSSSISQNAKRYATYELNWRDDHSDYISNDGISDININNTNDVSSSNSRNNDTSMNSAQAARCSLPSPTIIPLSQEQLQHNDQIKSSRHTRKSTPITINTKRRFSEPHDKNENEPQSPFGGITVTTVKVVEIHSPTEKHSSTRKDEFKRSSNKFQQRDLRPVPLDLSANPVGIITSERNERKQRINMSPPPPPPSTSQPPPPLPRIDIKNIKNENKKLVNQDPKILKQKNHSSIINSQKIKRGKSKNGKNPEIIIPKEMSFIDPRLLAHNKSLVRIPSTNRNRKTVKRGGGNVHRKRMPPKNLELSSTSNPVYSNDPTDMEADFPSVRRQMFPWLPNSTKPPQLLHASLVPLPHRVNRIIDNETSDSNNNLLLASANQKRNSRTSLNRLSRINSQRKRASIIVPNPNRASLIFRRQILEESLMMSFGGMMGGVQPQQPVVVSKQPIRRRTKKGSNAKVEDRETRRERRRKEKLEKKFGKKAQNDNVNGQIEGTNIENENRIIEPKVEGQKEIHMGPQPPPRKLPQDTTIGDHSPLQKRKNSNTSPLLSSPPERRLGNSKDDSTDEPPPFPAHLARSSFFEHSNKERSKRKQPPYSPLVVQPASLPISPISNYSSPSEGNGLVNEEVPQHETSSVQQLPSPKSQKTGGLLGFFNKQTSPPLSQISSVSHPTQLSLTPQSPTTSVPLTPSTPPQSPPSSPRSLRFRVGRSRHGVENGPSTPPAVQDQGKLRKMEQFEALIAKSETSSGKKPITEKIKAAITTAASSSSSREVYLENEQISGASSDIDSFKSLTDSVHYNPEEKPEFGLVGDDGVTLRVTLTPEVCR